MYEQGINPAIETSWRTIRRASIALLASCALLLPSNASAEEEESHAPAHPQYEIPQEHQPANVFAPDDRWESNPIVSNTTSAPLETPEADRETAKCLDIFEGAHTTIRVRKQTRKSLMVRVKTPALGACADKIDWESAATPVSKRRGQPARQGRTRRVTGGEDAESHYLRIRRIGVRYLKITSVATAEDGSDSRTAENRRVKLRRYAVR